MLRRLALLTLLLACMGALLLVRAASADEFSFSAPVTGAGNWLFEGPLNVHDGKFQEVFHLRQRPPAGVGHCRRRPHQHRRPGQGDRILRTGQRLQHRRQVPGRQVHRQFRRNAQLRPEPPRPDHDDTAGDAGRARAYRSGAAGRRKAAAATATRDNAGAEDEAGRPRRTDAGVAGTQAELGAASGSPAAVDGPRLLRSRRRRQPRSGNAGSIRKFQLANDWRRQGISMPSRSAS